MSNTGTVFSEPRLAHGAGKTFVTNVRVGEELPILDPHEINKTRSLGRHYGVRFVKTQTGLKRIV